MRCSESLQLHTGFLCKVSDKDDKHWSTIHIFLHKHAKIGDDFTTFQGSMRWFLTESLVRCDLARPGRCSELTGCDLIPGDRFLEPVEAMMIVDDWGGTSPLESGTTIPADLQNCGQGLKEEHDFLKVDGRSSFFLQLWSSGQWHHYSQWYWILRLVSLSACLFLWFLWQWFFLFMTIVGRNTSQCRPQIHPKTCGIPILILNTPERNHGGCREIPYNWDQWEGVESYPLGITTGRPFINDFPS